MILDEGTKPGINKKLTPRWKGPYKIIQIIGDTNYKIQTINKKKKKSFVVHRNKIKRYFGAVTESHIMVNKRTQVRAEDLEPVRAVVTHTTEPPVRSTPNHPETRTGAATPQNETVTIGHENISLTDPVMPTETDQYPRRERKRHPD